MARLPFLHCQRGRQVAIRVDLLPQVLYLLFSNGDRIGTGDEAAWCGLLVGDQEECLRQLGRVASLASVLGLVPFLLGCAALSIVSDRWLSVGGDASVSSSVRNMPGLTMVVLMPNGATSGASDSIQPSIAKCRKVDHARSSLRTAKCLASEDQSFCT